jgi:cyclopropane fatty-acyl-phospholipid synthase-like methyltransferase
MSQSKYNYADSAEDFLLEFFDKPQSQKETEILQILSNNPEWSLRYSLAPIREFILDWYNFENDSVVLEVGAGCGAVTGMYSRKVSKVIANELTVKRAEIIRRRYADLSNIEVHQCNLNDLKLEDLVDYISVIGVLEYSGRFFTKDTDKTFIDPYINFLKQLKKFIKPNGHILIAIENKLGIKYLAGGREDHYGNFFSSIQNYPNYDGIATFSKNELKKLINLAGFSKIDFYYPYPDYKLPKVVFSDEGLKANLNISKTSYLPIIDYSADRFPLFNEVMFGQALDEENILDKFSNSFLVDISQ